MANSNSNGSGSYSNLDWALAYQRTGLVLLPLWPNTKAPHSSKKPEHVDRALLGDGFKMSEVGECSEEWVRKCWGAGGDPKAGIGIVTGSRSQLIIVDVDTKNAGENEWEDWRATQLRQEFELPLGPVVRTPSGGFHLWFKLPEGMVLKSWHGWLPGVDILGDGNWAGAPPTIVRDKTTGVVNEYSFITEPMPTPEAPEWFLEHVGRHKRSRVPGHVNEHLGELVERTRFNWVWAQTPNEVPPGEQHNTLVSAACSARAFGWDDRRAVDELITVVRAFANHDDGWRWTDQDAIDKWEEIKDKYSAGVSEGLDEVEVPDYTPWSAREPVEEEVVEIDITGVDDRPRLRIIQGEGGGQNGQVSEPEVPNSGDDGGDGAGGGLPHFEGAGGWGQEPPTRGDTDEEHAQEFHRLYGEQVLWVPELSWHSWVGTHWKPDMAHDVDNLLTEMGYRIEAYRQQLDGREGFEDEVRDLRKRVTRLWNARSMLGVKTKAESYAQMWGGTALTAVDLDVQHDVVNTPGGTIEYESTGAITVREQRPEDLITRCTTVGYRPDARSELLDQYRSTFMPEEDHWEALWRLVGSCILGGNEFRQIILLVGESTTGKSQIMQLVKKVLGRYAELGTPSMVRGNSDERARADLMKVMYSRLVFIEELGKHNDMHGDRVKDLTGGGEVTARNLFAKQYITRPVEFTIIVTTNAPPVIKDSDNALLRRVKVIPFDRSVIMTEDTGIRQAMQNDQATQEAVLAELVHGAQRARERGVDDVPQRFLEARAEAYGALTGGDDLSDFIIELRHRGLLIAEPTKSKCIMVRELHELYATSPGRSRDRDIQGIDTRQFGKLLRMLGYEIKNVNGGSRIMGCGLKAGLSSVREWLRM